jgi:hypothetical protein
MHVNVLLLCSSNAIVRFGSDGSTITWTVTVFWLFLILALNPTNFFPTFTLHVSNSMQKETISSPSSSSFDTKEKKNSVG